MAEYPALRRPLMVAIDQYGQHVYLPGKHPRKELLAALNAKHADKVYVDTRDGLKHIGYVVRGRWFGLYTEWSMPA
jgi:CO dehydrogenase nickel-insertion accessory protein CooC1